MNYSSRYQILYQDSVLGSSTELLFSWYSLDNKTTFMNIPQKTSHYDYGDVLPELQNTFLISFILSATGGACGIIGIILLHFWLIWGTGWHHNKTLTPTHNQILGYFVNIFYVLFFLLCVTAVFQVLRVPDLLSRDKSLKDEYLFSCATSPNLICSKFMGTDTHLNITLTWRPALGWILAVAAASFALVAMLTSLSLKGYLSQYTRLEEIYPSTQEEGKHTSQYTSLGNRNDFS